MPDLISRIKQRLSFWVEYKSKLKYIIKIIWIKLFVKKFLFPFYQKIFKLTLRGMGVLNYENDKVTGEDFFLRRLFKGDSEYVVLDVGANVGRYANKIKSISPSAKIYAFEPNKEAFKLLRYEALKYGYFVFNLACGEAEGLAKLYYYAGKQNDSEYSSLYKEAIDKISSDSLIRQDVEITTIDQFVKKNGIIKINLLKIDTEGNELKVILGAKESIQKGMIEIIQFEFNEMNIISRVFFKDFSEQLSNYEFYRLLPDGLIKLCPYKPLLCEIFAFQNIVAIYKGCKLLK